ncbi:bifunctional diguanylate cyclase/phosphodiesterase [uncultured Clostridium sp.]|uniref:putative bifunctional diguanylate cyclase/phosphodiesterase n=1 Tax=uncultured Clostridium sp. TaxID=59620 RepID=UPI0026348817|nr:bifunctional diguanylate cyclase/phosphodiesterase [uncultured Clostridium sp.]
MDRKKYFLKRISIIGLLTLGLVVGSMNLVYKYTENEIHVFVDEIQDDIEQIEENSDKYTNDKEISTAILSKIEQDIDVSVNKIIFGSAGVFCVAAIMFAYLFLRVFSYKMMAKIRVIESDLKGLFIDEDNRGMLDTSTKLEQNIDGIIVSINEYKEKLNYSTKYDELTGLMNRSTFITELDKEIERGTKEDMILICINIDGFSYYNNNFGYHKGDEILNLVASTITRYIEIDSIIARIGGDEFAVVLKSDEINDTNIASYVEGLLIEINSIENTGVGGFISVSMGICTKSSKESTAAAMMNNAYLAMTTIKERQKNSFEFFTCKNKKDITLDMIERALKRGDIQLHYQPKVNLKTNKIDGVEALVRWFDDEHGYISPFSFIKIAEDTGYIITLGEWILNKAVNDINELNKELGTDISVAVNVSPIQFLQKSFLEKVKNAINNSGIDPRNLELELTESIGLFNSHDVVKKFEDISSLGVSIAIDDFGTGYSSIKYLKEFKINTIKIDRSFIMQGEKNRSIVRYIIDVSKTLGFRVVAEGVEDYMQARMLKELDCDYIQGYFFYKPMPVIRLREFVKR